MASRYSRPERTTLKVNKYCQRDQEINILLLGQTGVGKTTFINAFVNYISNDTLEQAVNTEMQVIIPSSFSFTTQDTFDERTIAIGTEDEYEKASADGESNTQQCRSFIFPIGDRNLRIIDTPSIGDTRGIELHRDHIESVPSLQKRGNQFHIIHLEKTELSFPLFRIPSTEKSNSSSTLTNQLINILLLGEKGVGKSTFINAFVNYLTYKTVAQAQSNRPIVLIPLSFFMMTNDQFEERTIKFGDFDHRDPSITQRCQSYTFDLNQNDGKKLCIIDTPSFDDRQDLDQDDSNNIRHILDYINNLTHLNAICFLFKPDESQLNSYQSYFAQILNRLGPNARQNVIFCFTNTGTTFSCLGRTASLLERMLATLSMKDITLSRTNTFLFENESFRYLVASQNGIMFDNDDKSEYIESWPESVNESHRLLNYIQTQLTPCRIVKK